MHPILFDLGPLPIHTFGVMVAIGYLLGTSWIVRQTTKAGFPRREVWNMLLLGLVTILVGGRLMFLLVEGIWHPERTFRSVEHFFKMAFGLGGLVFYGGFLLTFAGFWWYTRRRGWRFADIGDYCAAGGMLGLSVGRWGCFSAG